LLVSGINIQFLEISLNHKNMVSNGSKWETVVVNAIVILNNILMDIQLQFLIYYHLRPYFCDWVRFPRIGYLYLRLTTISFTLKFFKHWENTFTIKGEIHNKAVEAQKTTKPMGCFFKKPNDKFDSQLIMAETLFSNFVI
jgi:hypothetical protein